ncbi:MAG TPA: hypothetical protein VM680_09510 [Verrucomicrobiae bacterium]|nr:hypothetical protein [Verrucomicrobiae bacterium]
MKLSPRQKLTLTIVFAFLTVVVAAIFFITLPAPVDRKLHSEIGKALATEASALLRPGAKVTLITRDTATFPQPALDVLIKSFERNINRNTQVAKLTVAVDPLRPASVPPGDFFELLRKSKPDDVVVSLLGPPVLSDQQRFMLGGVQAKVIALCNGGMSANLNLRSLFDAGLLHAAVVSRQFAPTKTDTQRQIPRDFANLYQTYNAKELATLPTPAASALVDAHL